MKIITQNIRIILDTHFSETKDDIKDKAEKVILELTDSKASEVWVVSRLIPEVYSLELRFFTNEKAAKDFCAQYPGAEYNKYSLIETL